MKRLKIIAYKRKLKHKTDYRKRIALLAGHMPRLVVRKSLRKIAVQLVDFGANGDKVITSSSSLELKKHGWKYSFANLPAAYLTGLLIGNKASKLNIKKAILDLGLSRSVPGSSQYALVRGAIDSGLDVPCSKDVLPDESRILGKHIAEYSKTAASDKQFSYYKKEGLSIADMPKIVENLKSKLVKN